MIYILTRESFYKSYPLFSQQGYENPRVATGLLLSINKPVDLEVQAVLPDTLTFFEALSSSSKGALNVCASPIFDFTKQSTIGKFIFSFFPSSSQSFKLQSSFRHLQTLVHCFSSLFINLHKGIASSA